MAKKPKHSKTEIQAELAQADDLARQGKLQSEIERTLGVSVMTLHRWRKLPTVPQAMPARSNGSSQIDAVKISAIGARLLRDLAAASASAAVPGACRGGAAS